MIVCCVRMADAGGHAVWVCGCSIAGIMGLNPAEGVGARRVCLLDVCCVISGLSDELITR